MKYLISFLSSVLITVFSYTTQANSLDSLLAEVKSGSSQKTKEAASLEAKYKSLKTDQEKIAFIAQIKTQRGALEVSSNNLESNFEKNESELNVLRKKRETELGDLKELFVIVEQVSGETQAIFENSLVSAQFPSRNEGLEQITNKLNESNDVISADDIELVWKELVNEIVQQGKVVSFNVPVATVSGSKQELSVTRVGVFNLVGDGKFLTYGKGGVAQLPRQPDSRFLTQAKSLQSTAAGTPVAFSIDPTKGVLLGAAVERPSIGERIEQGGLVGKIIIAVGIVTLFVAVYKIIMLVLVSINVNRQAKNTDKPSSANPLGRILQIFADNPKSDTEALELKLSEAIMKETPKLNSWLMFLKIVAVVAPLMGLLGTVTGMIETFQSITLFGAGDPKLMAGGISQALVTTVLGLVVAIPTVLLHTAASSKAKRVQEILEEQSAGMVARQVEQRTELQA